MCRLCQSKLKRQVKLVTLKTKGLPWGKTILINILTFSSHFPKGCATPTASCPSVYGTQATTVQAACFSQKQSKAGSILLLDRKHTDALNTGHKHLQSTCPQPKPVWVKHLGTRDGQSHSWISVLETLVALKDGLWKACVRIQAYVAFHKLIFLQKPPIFMHLMAS